MPYSRQEGTPIAEVTFHASQTPDQQAGQPNTEHPELSFEAEQHPADYGRSDRQEEQWRAGSKQSSPGQQSCELAGERVYYSENEKSKQD